MDLPEPKFTALEYLGVILVLAGIALIVSSYGIIRTPWFEIQPGRLTRIIGVFLALLGGAILLAAQFTNRVAIIPSSLPFTNTETPALAASLPPATTVTPPAPVPSPTTLAIAQPTAWNLGKPFTYTDLQAVCTIKAEAVAQADREEAVKISYSIPAAGGFCGWGVNLNGYDASTQKSLTFWLRGDGGGERLKLGLKDKITPAGQEPKVILTASSAWERVSVPMEKFAGQNLSLLENFSISFEFNLGSGVIYVDGFIFE
jgi:hypothetical protein